MYCHDPKILAEPARRLRTQRLFANAFSVLLVVGIPIGLVLGRYFPANAYPNIAFASIFVLAMLVVAPRGFVANARFRGGSIACPCCGEPFTELRALPLIWVPDTCRNCGFNCVTVHRRGDF